MSDLSEFEEIVTQILAEDEGDIETWRAVYETVRDETQGDGKGTAMPSAIGSKAWDLLRDDNERDQALLDLFFAYEGWLENNRRNQQAHEVQTEESLLEPVDVTALQGDVDRQAGPTVEVERSRLVRVLAELERLQDRLAGEIGGGPDDR